MTGTHKILIGDVLTGLATIADGTVQTCVTSPPYWGLRDYGTGTWEGGDVGCGHVAGSNYGTKSDTNAGAIRGGPYRDTCGKCGARRIDQQIGLEPTPAAYLERMVAVFREVRRVLREDGTCWVNMGDGYCGGGRGGGAEDCKQRTNVGSLAAVPGVSVEGLKPEDLIGMPWRLAFALQSDGWYLRSDIIWHKPNPMPESVTDRPTKAHEYLFLLSKSARYYFDQEAVKEASECAGHIATSRSDSSGYDESETRGGKRWTGEVPPTRNIRTVWTIPTHPFPEAHFATYPETLVEPCVKAGSRPGDLVLDPFTGSGTTGAVACRLGRNFVGCELNPAYAAMAEDRIGKACRPATHRSERGEDAPLFV